MKKKIKQFFHYLKKPSFAIPFLSMWVLLESPLIVGIILGIITKNEKWYILASSWYALTALPLPIPVVPISVAFATIMERIIHKIRHPKKVE